MATKKKTQAKKKEVKVYKYVLVDFEKFEAGIESSYGANQHFVNQAKRGRTFEETKKFISEQNKALKDSLGIKDEKHPKYAVYRKWVKASSESLARAFNKRKKAPAKKAPAKKIKESDVLKKHRTSINASSKKDFFGHILSEVNNYIATNKLEANQVYTEFSEYFLKTTKIK